MSYILFADDNEDMRRMVRSLLEASGHEVALAASGAAALDSLRLREPDLLILDVSMPPGMTGFEVCRAVKANPFTARVPVLMLTGESEIERKMEGYEAGADDYLAKPFDPRELRARLTALLRLVKRESDRNPTSGLPGGRAIEDEIIARVARGRRFDVAYVDLDNFKAFADTFGFSVCDDIIRGTGAALRAAAEQATEGFVGHIGGDDFIVVTADGDAERVARDGAVRFREVVAQAVGSEVALAGSFVGRDRDGTLRRFPLAGISSAVLLVEPSNWVSLAQLGVVAAELKRKAKGRASGAVLVERV